MTMLDTGVLGAKRQTWHRVSPRDLLKKVLEDNRTRDPQKLFELFQEELEGQDDKEDYVAAIVEYWVANNLRQILKPIVTFEEKKQRLRARVSRKEVCKVALVQKIGEKAQLLFLTMVLPNGKQLRDCTSVECVKSGGFLKLIAKKVPVGKTVGDVFKSDEQLHKFWRKA